MPKRVLSGIQPSGKLHIGNYFGMIKRMVEYQETSDLFCFIANLHSLTTVQDADKLATMRREAILDMLALGIDPDKSHFWVQSDVPEVTELAWILANLTPTAMMERAVSYKEKAEQGIPTSLGLFSYPNLMAADILINQTEIVPVGKDQKQHLEMARDIAGKFNRAFGDTFTIPEPEIAEEVAIVPGTDGRKMSKSYDNTIPIFGKGNEIKKGVMSVVTDAKGVKEKKDPDTCNVFALYKLFASKEEQTELAKKYRAGGMGYGEAKNLLLKKVENTFTPFREKRAKLEKDPERVQEIIRKGAEKTRKVSLETMEKVRKATGLTY